jgi:DNA-binding NarL/FixJ family response regulator
MSRRPYSNPTVEDARGVARPDAAVQDPDERPVVSVVLAGDHPMCVDGMWRWLQGMDGVAVVGTAHDLASAPRLVEQKRPRVLVLDASRAHGGCVEAARQVRAVCPEVAILVVVGHEDLMERRALRELGVPGYVSRMASEEEFRGAVAAVARGRRVVVARGGRAASSVDVPRLTATEQDVLRRMAQGKTNAEIAAEMCVVKRTTEDHVERILGKLGAENRTEAVVRAQALGLVPPPTLEDALN